VALDVDTIAVIGGESGQGEDSAAATMDMKTYSVERGEWLTQPEMATARKDHACLVVEIDGNKGILVSSDVPREYRQSWLFR